AGDFEIALPVAEGLFVSQDIFLEDKMLHIIHNLKTSPYTFNSAIGVFDERFELRYSETALTLPDSSLVAAVKVKSEGATISVRSEQRNIESIVVYDVLGKKLFERQSLDVSDISIDQIQRNNQ